MTQHILITGTSSGIGHAAALRFARAGWNVTATMRNPAGADAAMSAMENIFVAEMDITDGASIAGALAQSEARFGAIDVVVNNAAYGQFGFFEAISDAELRASFETNLFGTANVMRQVLPAMRARRDGTILNISSCGALFGLPTSGVYVSTKWALEGLCESMWHELAAVGVRIKVLEPAGVDTPFLAKAGERSRETGGIADYQTFYETYQQAMTADHWALEDAETIAERIFAAVTDGTDRFRYFAGPPLQWLVDAKRRLSDAEYEQFMRARFEDPTSIA